MAENYSPDEKFLTQEFTLKRDELGDWLTDAMWEGLKDCFRAPICEETVCEKEVVADRVVGFVRTLYVDPENNFVTFEGLFWPKYSSKTKEEWNNIKLSNVSFYVVKEKNPTKIPVSCFTV